MWEDETCGWGSLSVAMAGWLVCVHAVEWSCCCEEWLCYVGEARGPLLWWEVSKSIAKGVWMRQGHSAGVYLLSPLEGMIVARDVGHNGPLVSLRGVDQVCKEGTWGVSAWGRAYLCVVLGVSAGEGRAHGYKMMLMYTHTYKESNILMLLVFMNDICTHTIW